MARWRGWLVGSERSVFRNPTHFLGPFDDAWNQKFQGQRVSEGEYDGLDSVEGVARGVVNEVGYAKPNQESGDDADENLVYAFKVFCFKRSNN